MFSGVILKRVEITEIRDRTYFADLVVSIGSNGEEKRIDCRPSDGTALAVRMGIDLLLNEELFLDSRRQRTQTMAFEVNGKPIGFKFDIDG